jgi:SAM-dependent methyltransferase
VKLCLSCGRAHDALDWRCPECGAEPRCVDGIRTFAPDVAESSDSFDPRAFAILATLEPQSFWFRGRNRLIAWTLQRHFPAARSLLEVGCGTGYVLAGIRAIAPQLTLAGSELFPQALTFARDRNPEATLYQMDARRVPFVEEWDVVGVFDVLEHIDEDEAALASIHRAVRPGGGVIVTVPQHARLWSTADEYAHHVRRYERDELCAKLQRAGFAVVRVTSFVTFLLPLMFASRWRDRRQPEVEYDSVREHGIGRMTPVLEATLDLELALIRRGWSLPVGGSLLAVARRGQVLSGGLSREEGR